MLKAVTFALLFFIACDLTSPIVAQQTTDSISKVTPQPVTIQTADQVAWRQRILALPRPTSGCFMINFPSEKWEAMPCGKSSTLLRVPVPVPKFSPSPTPPPAGWDPNVAGIGHEFVATAVGGPITAAEGFFIQTANVESVTSVKITNGVSSSADGAYALQLNATADGFSTSACANAQDPSQCQGWVQFLFFSDDKGSLADMEVWLLGFGPNCPGKGSIPQIPGMPAGIVWTQTSGNCEFDDETGLLPSIPITQLGQLRLRAEAQTGGLDSILVTYPDGTIALVSMSDEVLKLASAWTNAQFNVVGYINGQRAWFNSDAALVAQVNVENGTTNAPTISLDGISIESNDLHLVSPGCSNGGNPPNIIFEEVSLPSQLSQKCPPPPIPAAPPAEQCALAKSAIVGLQAQLKKAQDALNKSACADGFRVDCLRTVNADQEALTAAIAHEKQVCNP